MEFNLVAAVVSGLVATAIMTGMMTMAPTMGMPKMDMPALLGSMFGAPGNKMMGLVMHFMMGIIFAVILQQAFQINGVVAVVFAGVPVIQPPVASVGQNPQGRSL